MLKIDKPSPWAQVLGVVIFVLLIPVQMMFDGFVLKALYGERLYAWLKDMPATRRPKRQ